MKSLNEKIKEAIEKCHEQNLYEHTAEEVIEKLNESFGIDKFKIFRDKELLFSGDYVEFKELGSIAYMFGHFNYGLVIDFRYVDGYAELYTY